MAEREKFSGVDYSKGVDVKAEVHLDGRAIREEMERAWSLDAARQADPAALMATKTGPELAELMRAGTGQILLRLQVALRRAEDLERDVQAQKDARVAVDGALRQVQTELAQAIESIARLVRQANHDGGKDAETQAELDRAHGRHACVMEEKAVMVAELARAVAYGPAVPWTDLIRRAGELHQAWVDADTHRTELAATIGVDWSAAWSAPKPSWAVLKDAARQTREQLEALRERTAATTGADLEHRRLMGLALAAPVPGTGQAWGWTRLQNIAVELLGKLGIATDLDRANRLALARAIGAGPGCEWPALLERCAGLREESKKEATIRLDLRIADGSRDPDELFRRVAAEFGRALTRPVGSGG